MTNLLLMGLNHAGAPVEIRERLAAPPSRLPERLATLRAADGVAEAALLSTCNRFEIYAVVADLMSGQNALVDVLGLCDLHCYLYTASDGAAALHLCRVAAGLDSLVLGEHEILGQVKDALEAALAADAAGPVLSELFRRAIRAGKRVRSETAIGAGLRSLGQVALTLARQHLGDLTDRTALIIGVGRIAKVAAETLAAGGLRCVLVANRTYERAVALAEVLGGQAIRFDALVGRLVEADLVIAATGAPHVVLHADAVRQAMADRAGRPLIVVDLAVPRNVDPACRQIAGVTLYDMDDLSDVVRTQHAVAAPAVAAAEAIAAAEAAAFVAWLQERRAVPLIEDLFAQAEAIRQAEVAHCLARLPDAPEARQAAIEALGASLTRRLLFVAARAVKAAAVRGDGDSTLVWGDVSSLAVGDSSSKE